MIKGKLGHQNGQEYFEHLYCDFELIDSSRYCRMTL